MITFVSQKEGLKHERNVENPCRILLFLAAVLGAAECSKPSDLLHEETLFPEKDPRAHASILGGGAVSLIKPAKRLSQARYLKAATVRALSLFPFVRLRVKKEH